MLQCMCKIQHTNMMNYCRSHLIARTSCLVSPTALEASDNLSLVGAAERQALDPGCPRRAGIQSHHIAHFCYNSVLLLCLAADRALLLVCLIHVTA